MTKLTSRGNSPLFLKLPSSLLPWILSSIILPTALRAQGQAPPSPSPSDSPIPTPIPIPSTTPDDTASSSSTAASSSSIPSHTDTANYDPQNPINTEDAHVFNYYFLLIALVIAAFALVYWFVINRRHKRHASSRTNQDSALAQDVGSWPARRMGIGRWRHPAGETRREEGLDERGEAPPPYLKEPEQIHHARRDEGIELHDMDGGEGKPPDYEEEHVRR
ncbi:hypothetical protein ACLMJK_009683 [Lecanora helva]